MPTSGSAPRPPATASGMMDLIGRVTLGEVGMILSWEVTRLARNCSDWYPLLDLCGYRQCLIADRDGVYDPGWPERPPPSGLKGTISEIELHTLRGRLTAGLHSKAGTRRPGADPAGRSDARSCRRRDQGSGPGGAGPDRPGLRHLPGEGSAAQMMRTLRPRA